MPETVIIDENLSKRYPVEHQPNGHGSRRYTTLRDVIGHAHGAEFRRMQRSTSTVATASISPPPAPRRGAPGLIAVAIANQKAGWQPKSILPGSVQYPSPKLLN